MVTASSSTECDLSHSMDLGIQPRGSKLSQLSEAAIAEDGQLGLPSWRLSDLVASFHPHSPLPLLWSATRGLSPEETDPGALGEGAQGPLEKPKPSASRARPRKTRGNRGARTAWQV